MFIKGEPTTITELVDAAYSNAVDKGWHEEERTFGDLIALCHSELSEALEEFRNGRAPDEIHMSPTGKPEGIPIELADVVIRVADMCGMYGINLERAIERKMLYNLTRSKRHGGKVL